MITAKAWAGKHYAVYGLARSGRATVEALLASGARVTAWDASEAARAALLLPSPLGEGPGAGESSPGDFPAPSPRCGSSPPLKGRGSLTIADLDSADLTQFDSLVVTPGLPLNRHPIAQRARDAGVEIIGDIELFARARVELPPHKVVGITGTNGKSTTTALVHHILQTAGVPSLMGGNIGLPILSQYPLPEGGVYVLELSSYQIDLTQTLDCDVAVLLNITPDHIDRYDGFEGYAASKARLFEMQSPKGRAVIFMGEEATEAIAARFAERLFPVTTDGWSASGISLTEGLYSLRDAARDYDPTHLYVVGQNASRQDAWLTLQGPHNAKNVVAAVAVIELLGKIGSSFLKLHKALRTYPGLPHRMERIREKAGVLFVNDSKATNATATAPALAAFPAIRWICGGLAKADNLDECAPHFAHVRAAYTIGDASALFARLLRDAMPVIECGDLATAVGKTAADAQSGETVLLSPACASYDQFKDFEARGDAFRRLVGDL